VSDFISRIAARAVGAPPVARPRLLAFFAEHDAAAKDVAVVQEHVVSPAPPPSQAHAEPAPLEHRSEPIPEAEPSMREAPTQRIEVASPAPGDSVPVIERSMTHKRELAQAVHHVAPLAEAGHDPVPQAAPTVAVQAMPVVSEPERASAAPAPTSADEAPPVRVHIGRLEVRANLQQAPPQRPRRAEPRAQELTLSDYLRGKREAG
jgi:hypothetical protein